ncbi:HEAT repeat domain-containing protein [Nakamurella flavida]|uniref:HEAT repeat domain-containing protein n=1 Tax=Nakamurella flavida TaxID=363630 RepID=A0A938YGZ8_9ACTN|nr:HEAT repeat domain-containing protein [Nakamurella flavida]MBM9477515.1 HEAT repeat domain-containing protein [Nakamurella flavida]MDP9777448.1 HEAT repeat protein [Nakamurella flavida]
MEDSTAAWKLRTALTAAEPSARLQAAMAAGTRPDPGYVEVLVERCAVEPDFSVREILTWALIRHDPELTIDPLLVELRSETPQARSQALHTLSKIGDQRAWPAITPALLADAHDDVARAAWRTAAGLVPAEQRVALAETLTAQLGRGERDVQLSLCRAFATLGEVALPALRRSRTDPHPAVRAHAIAAERLIRDPEEPPFAFLDTEQS